MSKDIRYEKSVDILMDYILKNKTQDLMLKQDLINDYVKKILNQIELEGKVFETNEIKTRQSVSLNFKYFLRTQNI